MPLGLPHPAEVVGHLIGVVVVVIINRSGKAMAPKDAGERPHPAFLAWHRENCFKR